MTLLHIFAILNYNNKLSALQGRRENEFLKIGLLRKKLLNVITLRS